MITFKFDKETGRYEYKLITFLNKDDLSALKAFVEQRWLDHETFGLSFPEYTEDNIYQAFTNLTYKLAHIGLIEWKNDERVLMKADKTNYNNNVYEEHSGYFLTEMGKALLHSFGLKPKSLYDA